MQTCLFNKEMIRKETIEEADKFEGLQLCKEASLVWSRDKRAAFAMCTNYEKLLTECRKEDAIKLYKESW